MFKRYRYLRRNTMDSTSDVEIVIFQIKSEMAKVKGEGAEYKCLVTAEINKHLQNNFSFKNSQLGISSYILGASKQKSSGSSPVASGGSRRKSTQKVSSSGYCSIASPSSVSAWLFIACTNQSRSTSSTHLKVDSYYYRMIFLYVY